MFDVSPLRLALVSVLVFGVVIAPCCCLAEEKSETELAFEGLIYKLGLDDSFFQSTIEADSVLLLNQGSKSGNDDRNLQQQCESQFASCFGNNTCEAELCCTSSRCTCSVKVNGRTCRSCGICSSGDASIDCSNEIQECDTVVGSTCSGTSIYTPSCSQCTDSPSGWVDSSGDDCSWYEGRTSSCSDYENDGLTASDVCCVCGGGRVSSNPASSSVPIAVVVGASVAGLAVIGGIIIAWVLCKKRKKNASSSLSKHKVGDRDEDETFEVGVEVPYEASEAEATPMPTEDPIEALSPGNKRIIKTVHPDGRVTTTITEFFPAPGTDD